MQQMRFDRQTLTDSSWWHWAATVPLLAAHLLRYPGALTAALLLCAIVGGYFFLRLRQVRPFPVQVRLAYLGLLFVGTLPWMAWIHWTQLAGTSAMVAVGYCPLARMLSLLPWNRNEPLSRALAWRVFVQDSCSGGLVQWAAVSSPASGACCSLRGSPVQATCSLRVPVEGGERHPILSAVSHRKIAGPLASARSE